ncbi:MAG TPA: TonB-dependent receptor [Burkholderiaceae bacterium]
MKNSTGKRSAASFKLKPTMVFAGQAVAGAYIAFAATGVYAQAEPAAAAPAPGAAASGAASDTQQVVVTGIRKGIEAAISVKKNSDQIVEAISAEDIGKLPDTTIAESLARLPGVTAQRDKSGNATNVSIRGLGPDFNGYLLNGREQTSTGDSRADDLSVYPAELIAGATVYKTGDASLMTAGLAGTIDNKLIDPLMMPKRMVAVSYEKDRTGVGLHDLGHGNKYSLIYVDQFADRKIGVALGFVHKFGRTNEVGGGNWGDGGHQAFDANGNNLGTFVPATVDANGNTVPAHYTDVNLPGFGSGISLQNTHKRDDRDGLAGVLEFKPNANFTSEIDFYHAKILTSTKNAVVKFGMGNLPVTNATVSNGAITAGTVQLGANPNGLIDYSENISDNDTLQSFGWRNSVKLSDTWRMVADYSHNSAKRVERDIEAYAGLTSADTLSFTTPNGFGVPQLAVGNPSAYTSPGSIVIRDQSGWSGTNAAQAGYDKGPTTIDKIDAKRLDFTHDLASGMFSDVQFGANQTTRTKDRAADEALIVSTTGGGYDPISFPAGSYVEQNVGGTGLNLLTFDPLPGLWPGATLQRKYNNDILSKTWTVKEDVTTVYGKLDVDTEMGKIPVRGNIGLQYVYTNQSSAGYQANVGSGVTLTNPASTQTTSGTRYGNLLPSLNLTGDLGNGNLVRFGAGIELARPTLTDLRNSFAVSLVPLTGSNCTDAQGNPCTVLSGSSGNPYLKPFKAKAIDLSYEKYFADKEGYLSAAVFYKKLDTYIVNSSESAHDFSAQAQALGVTPSPVFGYVGPYVTTVNGHGGNLKGFEITAQVPFSMLSPWLSGFGINGSFSDTTSSIQSPNTIGLNPLQPAAAGTIPLTGLSHLNKKLMVYYERGGFSAFAAENYRSEYVGSVANTTVGGYPTLVFIKPQRWLSAQVGYEVQSGWLKGLGVRLEGNNLNKPVYQEANYAGSITTTNKTGASVDLRVSYKL